MFGAIKERGSESKTDKFWYCSTPKLFIMGVQLKKIKIKIKKVPILTYLNPVYEQESALC